MEIIDKINIKMKGLKTINVKVKLYECKILPIENLKKIRILERWNIGTKTLF